MNLFTDYVTCLRHNPHGYWFKRKIYGWGWTPVRWQGWLVLVAATVLIVWNFLRIDALSHSVSDTLINAVPQTIFIFALLIAIAYWKGEPPRWQWGIPPSKPDDTARP